jgi:hypothetical protein
MVPAFGFFRNYADRRPQRLKRPFSVAHARRPTLPDRLSGVVGGATLP